MQYYNEETGKLFNTVEEYEEDQKIQEKEKAKEKELATQKNARRNTILDKLQAKNKMEKEIKSLITAYCEEYKEGYFEDDDGKCYVYQDRPTSVADIFNKIYPTISW